MLLVRDLATLALLTVACTADDIGQRFFFPSQQLLLDAPDAAADAGHGRRIPTSGEAAEGGTARVGGGGGRRPPASDSSAAAETPVRRAREPSRCTFAIVGCCRAGSVRVDESCFSQFQCHGPFWGESPCRRESAVVAHNVVSKYYAAKEAEKRGEEEAAEGAGVAAEGEAAAAPAREPEPSSPFDPIGPLPSREDARRHG